jgi:Fe-coproporphyrin III synthase
MTDIKNHLRLAGFGLQVGLRQGYNYLFSQDKKLPIAIIDTTHKCNLSCTLCYYKRKKNQEQLSIKDWEKELQRIKNQGVKLIVWTGGEPLLRKELIELGQKLFPYHIVFTNGTHSLPNWPRTRFFVSVDGCEENYIKIRGDNYQKVKQNIQDSRQKIILSTTLTSENIPISFYSVQKLFKII